VDLEVGGSRGFLGKIYAWEVGRLDGKGGQSYGG